MNIRVGRRYKYIPNSGMEGINGGPGYFDSGCQDASYYGEIVTITHVYTGRDMWFEGTFDDVDMTGVFIPSVLKPIYEYVSFNPVNGPEDVDYE